jgi:hypothetical protein
LIFSVFTVQNILQSKFGRIIPNFIKFHGSLGSIFFVTSNFQTLLASAGSAETSGTRRACYLPTPITAQPYVSVTPCWNWTGETGRRGPVHAAQTAPPFKSHPAALTQPRPRSRSLPPLLPPAFPPPTRAHPIAAPPSPRFGRGSTGAAPLLVPPDLRRRFAPPPDPVSPRYPPRLLPLPVSFPVAYSARSDPYCLWHTCGRVSRMGGVIPLFASVGRRSPILSRCRVDCFRFQCLIVTGALTPALLIAQAYRIDYPCW